MLIAWWLYLPAVAWLLASAAASIRGARVPTSVMLAVTLAGVVFVAVTSGPVWALTSLLASAVIFLGFALSGFVQRSTTITVVPAIAALPPTGWWPLLLGAGLLGALSTVLLVRSFGRDHVGGVAVGTLHAMGVGGVGPRLFGLTKPQLDAFPVPSATRRQPRILVGFVLAAPVALFAVIAGLVG